MVDSMVTRSIKNKLEDGGQLVNLFCMNPKLVEEVEVMVEQHLRWRDADDGHWNECGKGVILVPGFEIVTRII